MKTVPLTTSIILHIVFFVLGWVANEYFRQDNTGILNQQIKVIQEEKQSLIAEKKSSEEKIQFLKGVAVDQREEIDSLARELRRIKIAIFVKQEVIDSLILTDSTRAIELYRKALETLGVIPDMSERLTLREIGHGAKYLAQIPQLKLTISLQDQSLDEYKLLNKLNKETIGELEHLKETEKRINKQSELQSDLYKAAYDNATRFWANRIVVSAGVGVSYLTNKTFEPSLFVGIGIKLWGNK